MQRVMVLFFILVTRRLFALKLKKKEKKVVHSVLVFVVLDDAILIVKADKAHTLKLHTL